MFKNAVDLFEIFGFRIRVDPSWLIIAALIVWSLSTSYFPVELPGLNRFDYIGISIIAMLGLFVSLILHELSHSLVARMFDLKVGGITLFIFGGVAELEQNPRNAASEFWIAIVGPLMSIALAGVFYTTQGILPAVGASPLIISLFGYLALINLVLALFNLVPAFPLDGGRVLRAAIWHFKNDLMTATRIASRIGIAFAIFLMAVGLVSLFMSQTMGGLWQILIGFFILGASRSSYEDLVIKQILKGQTVHSLMTKTPWIAKPGDSVQSLVDTVILQKSISFIPVVEEGHLLGYVDAAMVQTIDRENWSDTKLSDIYVASDNSNTFLPDTPMQDIFTQMAKTGRRKILIAKEGRLQGVISFADLMSYLAIRSGLAPTSNAETIGKRKSAIYE